MSSFAGGERQEAESRAEAEADTETKLRALSAFWQRHCKSFSLWYLMLSPETQVETLLQCCSDMPRKRANGGGSATRPSELILPEFYAEELNGNQGRGLIVYMTSRLVSTDLCLHEDIQMLECLRSRSQLPKFSQKALDKCRLPFVDRADPSHSIQTVGEGEDERTMKVLAEVERQISTGDLVHAETWLALQLRRAAIASTLASIVQLHQQAMKTAAEKPSPTYGALLAAELALAGQVGQVVGGVASKEAVPKVEEETSKM